MANPVSGFMTDDGTFFATAAAAELHEATEELKRILINVYKIDAGRFLSVIDHEAEAVERVCKAVITINPAGVQTDTLKARRGASNNSSGQSETEAVQ